MAARLTVFIDKPLSPGDDYYILTGDEAHYLSRVVRARIGANVKVLNGAGCYAKAVVENIEKTKVKLRVLEQKTAKKPCIALHWIQALPKSKGFDDVLRSAVEIGVDSISPIIAEHSEFKINFDKKAHLHARWRSIAINACKQSGRPFLPDLKPISSLASFLTDFNQSASSSLCLVASLEENPESIDTYLSSVQLKTPITDIYFLIGPEGDFSPSEYEHIRSRGFVPVRLTQSILRVETAALYTLIAVDIWRQKKTVPSD